MTATARLSLDVPLDVPLDVEALWRLDRVGAPSMSPDGVYAVCAVTRYSMKRNQGSTALWRLSTRGGAPRRLTSCGDKDGQPAWSPKGDQIAFIARREQGGKKDATPQLYTLPADGGEAVRRSQFAPGIEAFKWLPDGKGVVFSAWVWPALKGAAAQAKAHKANSERKDTGYATSEAFYRYWDRNLPQGRVLHLLHLDLASGKVTDLFEGTSLELPRDGGDSGSFDIHPSGRWVAFHHDTASVPLLGNRTAVSEIDLRDRDRDRNHSRKLLWQVAHKAWDIGAPRYSPDGQHLALIAAHVGLDHNAPGQVVVLQRGRPFEPAAVLAPGWDRQPNAPLRWAPDGQALYFTAEDRGRCPLWRLDLNAAEPSVAVPGGWVQGFDLAGDTLLTLADSQQHPARVHAHRLNSHKAPETPATPATPATSTTPQTRRAPQTPRMPNSPTSPTTPTTPALRLETFNDAELARVPFGPVQEVTLTGAQGDAVQMWLTFPPGFNARKKHALLHVIHGGPFAAAGDTFSWRWNAHVLASQGHVVAQVNYHGSSGFGFEFKRSLVGRQGELELQDIEAGTEWLLAQPWADKRRVFAAGGSYGGFLVAWMNGHVPAGRYRAYICHAGVFDRVATFSADSWPVRPKDLAAKYWEDMPHVLAQSPHAFAGQMNTPTLVIHGAQDFRVPDCNGLAYYNTLKARGVDARLLWFPDENHWVLKPQNSRQWYGEFLSWLQAQDLPAHRLPVAGKGHG